MDSVTTLLSILFIPFLSAGLITLFFRRWGKTAAVISVIAAFLIAVLSIYFIYNWNGEIFHAYRTWFELGELTVNMGFFIDQNAAIMLLVVSFIGFWIHLFSVGYMKDDEGKGRYFAGLSIFMFSMIGIVLADNLIMLFVFWELVGFSSYGLIAHYKDTEEASNASKKAFIVNRVGDFGFLIGIVLVYWQFGTVSLVPISGIADSGWASSLTAFLLICGFIGKSAQFPLQVWLPDAMAGPTPVSALIHAATMVAAGIYLLIRIFTLIPVDILELILWLGTLMALYAGFCALAQSDIKRILAYSTLSQLGYMAAAVGLGYPGLALFHLATHAAFKALLFLGAGSVINGLHHEQDIFKMGGLFRRMPLTTITFAIGLLALCGVTYTSGYFSKDAIIDASLFFNVKVYGLLLFAAFLTSLYMGRLFWIAFWGRPNSDNAQQAHESGFVMILPLIVLAICSLMAGYVTLWPERLNLAFINELTDVHHLIEFNNLTGKVFLASSLTWILGLSISALFYGLGAKKDRLLEWMPRFFNLLKSKLYFDEIYNFYVQNIQQRVANLLSFIDIVIISGLLVRGSAGVIGMLGLGARSMQTGGLHVYVFWFLIGLLLFSSFAFDWL